MATSTATQPTETAIAELLRLGRLVAGFDRRATPREEVVAAITGAGATPAP
jgi:hypothetical protein